MRFQFLFESVEMLRRAGGGILFPPPFVCVFVSKITQKAIGGFSCVSIDVDAMHFYKLSFGTVSRLVYNHFRDSCLESPV